MRHWMRLALLALPFSPAGHAISSPDATRFAAPEVIVATGGPLTRRVVLTDFDENRRLMLAATEIAPVQSATFRSRPRIRLAMYWGVQWQGKANLPDSVTPTAAANGAQTGAFYPGFRGEPAVWLFGAYGPMRASARHVTPDGLAILARHKI